MNLIPIVFLCIASYTDIKQKKIKNSLTYPLIALGTIVSSYFNGIEGLVNSLGGILIALLLTLFLPGFRHGGGDIKLAMGIGSFLGLSQMKYFLFIWLALSLLICNMKFLRNKGFRHFKSTMYNEIITLGNVAEGEIESTVGAPVMLAAYLITLTIGG